MFSSYSADVSKSEWGEEGLTNVKGERKGGTYASSFEFQGCFKGIAGVV